MARRVASAEEAVQKYGQHLATPAAQGESTVPLPKEFEELRQRTLALQEEEYWVAHSLQDEALEFRLQAVAFVSHGAFLHKFRKSGREKPHRRFVKVTGGEGLCILHWEKKSAAVVRADAEVYESCFQGVDLLDEGTCFQVILEKRMLFFQAESPEELQLWVSGVNAIVTGEAVILAEEALGGTGLTSSQWLAVQDVATGGTYYYNAVTKEKTWINSTRSLRTSTAPAPYGAAAAYAAAPAASMPPLLEAGDSRGAPVPDGGRAASMSGDSLISVRPSAAAGGAFDRVASIPPKVASMPPPLPGIAPPPSMVGRGDLPPADAAASAMSSVEARLNAARVSGMAAGRRNSGASLMAPPPSLTGAADAQAAYSAAQAAATEKEEARRAEAAAQRDAMAAQAIASAEERARIFQQLQATVDAEELKRHEAEEKVRREQEAVEEAARLKREAEERAVREAEEKVRREQEAAAAAVAAAEAQAAAEAEGTANLQAALQTQDLATLQAAVNHYGPALRAGSAQAQADLATVEAYLAQLQEAHNAYVAEVTAATEALSALSVAPLAAPHAAAAAMSEVQAAAERVVAAGVGEPALFEAAQARVNELFQLNATWEGACNAALAAIAHAEAAAQAAAAQGVEAGFAACPPLEAAVAAGRDAVLPPGEASDRLDGAAALLGRLQKAEADRVEELQAAGLHLHGVAQEAATSYAAAAAAGDRLRDFTLLPVLTEAIRRAQAAGVDKGLVDVSSQHAAAHAEAKAVHEAEVAQLAAAADAAAAGNDATALGAAIDAAKPLAAHLPAGCLARAEAKYRAMNAAKSMAETGMQLHKLCQTAEGAEGAKAVREMLATAKAAGVAEALLAIAEEKLEELKEAEEAAEREAEAVRWIEEQEAKRRAAAGLPPKAADDGEAEKERRKAELKAKKKAEREAAGGDLLSRAAAAQGVQLSGERSRSASSAAGAAAARPSKAASTWQAITAPDGRVYYYDAATNQTSWERPAELDEGGAGGGGEDLEGMSVKELKALLQRRKVDLGGLTDKSELLEAARKLPKERWNAVVAQDGRTYYVNEATNETSWVKPAGM